MQDIVARGVRPDDIDYALNVTELDEAWDKVFSDGFVVDEYELDLVWGEFYQRFPSYAVFPSASSFVGGLLNSGYAPPGLLMAYQSTAETDDTRFFAATVVFGALSQYDVGRSNIWDGVKRAVVLGIQVDRRWDADDINSYVEKSIGDNSARLKINPVNAGRAWEKVYKDDIIRLVEGVAQSSKADTFQKNLQSKIGREFVQTNGKTNFAGDSVIELNPILNVSNLIPAYLRAKGDEKADVYTLARGDVVPVARKNDPASLDKLLNPKVAPDIGVTKIVGLRATNAVSAYVSAVEAGAQSKIVDLDGILAHLYPADATTRTDEEKAQFSGYLLGVVSQTKGVLERAVDGVRKDTEIPLLPLSVGHRIFTLAMMITKLNGSGDTKTTVAAKLGAKGFASKVPHGFTVAVAEKLDAVVGRPAIDVPMADASKPARKEDKRAKHDKGSKSSKDKKAKKAKKSKVLPVLDKVGIRVKTFQNIIEEGMATPNRPLAELAGIYKAKSPGAKGLFSYILGALTASVPNIQELMVDYDKKRGKEPFLLGKEDADQRRAMTLAMIQALMGHKYESGEAKRKTREVALIMSPHGYPKMPAWLKDDKTVKVIAKFAAKLGPNVVESSASGSEGMLGEGDATSEADEIPVVPASASSSESVESISDEEEHGLFDEPAMSDIVASGSESDEEATDPLVMLEHIRASTDDAGRTAFKAKSFMKKAYKDALNGRKTYEQLIEDIRGENYEDDVRNDVYTAALVGLIDKVDPKHRLDKLVEVAPEIVLGDRRHALLDGIYASKTLQLPLEEFELSDDEREKLKADLLTVRFDWYEFEDNDDAVRWAQELKLVLVGYSNTLRQLVGLDNKLERLYKSAGAVARVKHFFRQAAEADTYILPDEQLDYIERNFWDGRPANPGTQQVEVNYPNVEALMAFTRHGNVYRDLYRALFPEKKPFYPKMFRDRLHARGAWGFEDGVTEESIQKAIARLNGRVSDGIAQVLAVQTNYANQTKTRSPLVTTEEPEPKRARVADMVDLANDEDMFEVTGSVPGRVVVKQELPSGTAETKIEAAEKAIDRIRRVEDWRAAYERASVFVQQALQYDASSEKLQMRQRRLQKRLESVAGLRREQDAKLAPEQMFSHFKAFVDKYGFDRAEPELMATAKANFMRQLDKYPSLNSRHVDKFYELLVKNDYDGYFTFIAEPREWIDAHIDEIMEAGSLARAFAKLSLTQRMQAVMLQD